VRLKVGWSERGAGSFTHALLLFTWEMVGRSWTTSSKAWCRLDDDLLAWRRALNTRSTLFYVRVGRTSVAPSALHTLFSSVTWWRAHNLS
jgi:hypothetical protein